MGKSSSAFICQQCGFKSSQFLGRCPQCGSWNSLVETIEQEVRLAGKARVQIIPQIINLADVDNQKYDRIDTGLEEFNRSLGGGIVVGSLTLVSGDPGIGKSTLLTQLALNVEDTLYVAGEESPHQIKLRVNRIKPGGTLKVLPEVDVDVIAVAIRDTKPKLVIIDSIQTLQTSDLNSVAGSIGQVRESSHRLQKIAKELHVPIFIVGHVTKEGTVAGPKTLEHLVDVVLSLEGEPSSNFRILRSNKNRFGPTDEVGIFEMEESGMTEVKNPSKIFVSDNLGGVPGSVIVSTLTGLRPMLVEIQALVTKSFLPAPMRRGSGIDGNRLQLLVAVISKRLGLPLFDKDVFVNVTGGLKVYEPAADLAICLAVISSLKDQPLSTETVVLGEVGLLGEIRAVRQLNKRVLEAKKLGFKNVISPENVHSLPQAVKLLLHKCG